MSSTHASNTRETRENFEKSMQKTREMLDNLVILSKGVSVSPAPVTSVGGKTVAKTPKGTVSKDAYIEAYDIFVEAAASRINETANLGEKDGGDIGRPSVKIGKSPFTNLFSFDINFTYVDYPRDVGNGSVPVMDVEESVSAGQRLHESLVARFCTDEQLKMMALTGYQKSRILFETDYAINKWTCTGCSGNGSVSCSACGTRGDVMCTSCSLGYQSCFHCHGRGYDEDANYRRFACSQCNGHGKRVCHTCNGRTRCVCGSCGGGGYRQCGGCTGTGRVSRVHSASFTCTSDMRMDTGSLPSVVGREAVDWLSGGILKRDYHGNVKPDIDMRTVRVVKKDRSSYLVEGVASLPYIRTPVEIDGAESGEIIYADFRDVPVLRCSPVCDRYMGRVLETINGCGTPSEMIAALKKVGFGSIATHLRDQPDEMPTIIERSTFGAISAGSLMSARIAYLSSVDSYTSRAKRKAWKWPAAFGVSALVASDQMGLFQYMTTFRVAPIIMCLAVALVAGFIAFVSGNIEGTRTIRREAPHFMGRGIGWPGFMVACFTFLAFLAAGLRAYGAL